MKFSLILCISVPTEPVLQESFGERNHKGRRAE